MKAVIVRNGRDEGFFLTVHPLFDRQDYRSTRASVCGLPAKSFY